jgi:hypothetical protein
MKRCDLKPAHPRWSSEESVRGALLRPLVWTVGFSKHLEQLRGDRLVQHILSTATERFVEVGIRRDQMVDGPASRGPRRSPFHGAILGAILVRTNVKERATGIVVPPDGSPEATDPRPSRRPSELDAARGRTALNAAAEEAAACAGRGPIV